MKLQRITTKPKLELLFCQHNYNCHRHQHQYQNRQPQMRRLNFTRGILVNIIAFNALVACISMLAIAQDSSQSNPSETHIRSQLESVRKFIKRDTDDLEPNPGPEPSETDSDSPESYAAANSDTDANYQGSATGGGGDEINGEYSAAVTDESSTGEPDSTDATDLQPVLASNSRSRAEFAGTHNRHIVGNSSNNNARASVRSQGSGPIVESMRNLQNVDQIHSTMQHHHPQLQPQAIRAPQLNHTTTSTSIPVSNVRRNAAERTSMNSPPTTMMPTMRFGQSTNHQQVRQQQFQTQSQPQLTSRAQEIRPSIPPSAFNVDMGADRMLIKPAQPLQQKQQQQRSTTISPLNMATLANIMDQEMATETINHELLSQNGVNNGGVTAMNPSILNGSNQRRQDLLYPTRLDNSNSRHLINSFEGKNIPTNSYLNDLQPQEASQVQVPSICYTPLALLIVILVTMMITVVVCFCTHIVIRYLSRHQFDLIESSKKFDTKRGSSSSGGRSLEGAAQQQRNIQTQQGSTAMLFNSSSNLNNTTGLGDEDNNNNNSNNKQSCMLSLFRADQTVSPDSKAIQRLRDEHGFAFDNPYFRDEAPNQRYLHHSQQQQQQQQETFIHHTSGGGSVGGLLQTAINEGLVEAGRNRVRGDENVAMIQKRMAGNEQLHFIEHHISNLHNRQVTSSVKELSILGSPGNQNVAHVVDLTSEEQRSRIIADPKEGDLVAVDITGHDIIGLGFDICGNQHDGVFIKSVFSHGPARESGCIETGDRIKCLNISFDNVTLQDACDILNCGSPYKMRLLLEKRAAPAKLTEKLSKSPAPRTLYYGSKLALVPDGSSSSISLNRGRNNQQLVVSSGGALSATRNYFRRLANMIISPSANRARINHGHHLDYRNQYDIGTSSGNLNYNESLVNGQVPYLGSAVARKQLFSNGMQLTSDSSMNEANGDMQTTITQRVAEPSTFEEARITSRVPIITSSPMSAQQRCLSHSDSIGSNLRGRFSVDSQTEMLNVGSSTNDFNTDSSLDYQNKNANHRLHGPQFESRVGQRMQVEDITDLRMVASQNQLNSHNRSTAIAARRQSVACVMQTSGRGSIKDNLKDLSSSHHLEQTQSQPEIALSDKETTTGNSMARQLSGDERDAVDERIEILPSSRSNNLPSASDTRNGRFQMMSSASTPSVNLLGSSNQQQSTLSNNSSSGADWRQAPSLRRKRQHQELKESIREETGGGSDSSYADSTSKLVEKKEEQSTTTGTNSNDSRGNSASTSNMYQRDTDNSRPTVTQLARNLESRAGSSSSSATTTTLSSNSRDALTNIINRNKMLQDDRD